MALILASLLGSVNAYSQTVSHGLWEKADGALVSMLCPKEYGEVTRLPKGCINGLSGGGVLFTPKAYSQNNADLEKASVLIKGLKLNVSNLRTKIDNLVEQHKIEIEAITRKSVDELESVVAASRKETKSAWFYGMLGGAVFGFILCVLT